MKRILFVVNYILEGGVAHILLDTVRILSDKYIITILSIYNSDPIFIKEVEKYATYYTLDGKRSLFGSLGVLSIYSRFFDNYHLQQFLYRQFISRHTFDYEVAYAEGWAINAVSSSNSHAKKYVWVHTDFLCNGVDDSQRSISNFSILLNKFDKCVFVSHNLQQKFSRLLNLSKTEVIHNSVNVNYIQSKSHELYDNAIPQSPLNMIYVGRVSREKGLDILIDAICLLPGEMQNKVHLTIVGDGDYSSYIKNIIRERHLERNVLLLGRKLNPYVYMAKTDLMVLPSRYEGFGLVLVEAMALGLPCLATSTVGATEILNGGQYGIITEISSSSICDALVDIISHPEKLQYYRAQSRVRCLYYSMDDFKNKLFNLF